MKHGSLFSGIGGFDYIAECVGWENIFQVEIDEYCQKALTKNFPNVKRYGDIKKFKGEKGSVDVLTGGFPCQPFSTAGKRKGKSDDRYLWPEYLRVISEIKPSYVVGENVPGLVSMGDGKVLDGIFTDLESEGYQVEAYLIPACGVQAWHRRERFWIIAYSESSGNRRGLREVYGAKEERPKPKEQHKDNAEQLNDAGEILSRTLPQRNESNPPRTNTNSIGSHRQKEQQQGETELRHEQEREFEGLGEDVPDTQCINDDGTGYGSSTICGEQSQQTEIQRCKDVPDTKPKRLQGQSERQMEGSSESTEDGEGVGRTRQRRLRERESGTWSTEPNVGDLVNGLSPELAARVRRRLRRYGIDPGDRAIPRVATGISGRVNRLKGLGNAIVPQVVYELFRAIEIHHQTQIYMSNYKS